MDARSTSPRVRRLRSTLAVAAAATLALTACSGGSFGGEEAADADRPLRIGLIAPLTGPASLEGNAMTNGFKLGLEQVNEAGGVLGKEVELVVVDDKSDVATSTQVAQQLVRQDDVDYIFGTIAGDTSFAVASVAKDAVVPFSTAIDGTIEFCSPHFWPFGASESMLLDPLVPHMVEQFGGRVALVGNDYLFPRGYNAVATALIAEAGGEVVVEEYSPLGTSDWQPVIAKIAAADPDWILTSVVGGDAVAFMNQADQFGLLDGRGVSGVALKQEFYGGLGAIVEGREAVLPYSDQTKGGGNEEFVAAYTAAYGDQGPIPGVAATAYMAAQFIAEAVEAAGSLEADQISAQMSKIELDGLLGKLSFREDNHYVSSNMYLVRVDEGGVYTTIEDLGVLDDATPRSCS